KMRDVITGLTRDDIPTQVCVRVLSKKPGLKDTNFQVLGVKLNLVSHLAMNSKFSQTSAQCILGDMVDKVGDVKNGGTCQEALSCIAEATSLEFVAQEVMKLAFAQKNPKNQSEALNWLAKAVKEFGFKINVKPVIEVLKKAFAATNPAVRTSAIAFVAVAHMYMGPTLRTLFEDEKPALLQQIDDEIAKVQGEKPPAPTRGTTPKDKGGDDDDEEEEEGEEQADVADLVPRNDISDKITEEIVTEMADKNWKIRNEALQKVAAIINEAKFITPNLGSLPEALKARLGDSNKILVSTCLTICQTLATAIGPKIKQHVRIIGPGMVGCFGDSKPQLRAATGTALDAWVEQCTLLPFLEGEIFSEHLKKGNPNLKTELLGWLATKLPSCKKVPKDNKEELLACISSILTCLEDRNAGVRTKAQEALVPFMIHTGYDAFLKACNSLPASSKEPVKAQLDKARENLPAKPPPKSKSTTSAAPTPVAAPPEDDEPEPAPSAPKAAAKSPPKAEGKPKAGGKIVVRGMKKGPAAGKSSKKDVEVDLSPPLTIGSSKEKRMKDEKNLKTLKWNFTSPLPEFVEQLKKDMEQNVNKTLMDQMFNKDFKQHIKALDTLIKAVEEHRDATVANLDLILRWMTLRFFETNPTVHIKALEYLASVFSLLAEEDYHLLEFEAYAFVPYLILKVGDKNENIRRGVRNIFKLICKIYPASKMFSFILDGLKSKNSKQRTECLEELGSLIEVYGINVCQPSPAQALKLIAGQISDRDNSVRSAALNTAVEAYVILGESVFKYIGNLPDKEQAMLEERIKRSNKNRPATAQQPQPVKTSPDRERPQTAPAAAASKAKMQGIPGPRVATPVRRSASGNVKREFALELDDQDEPNKYEMPKLVDVDVDEILNDTVQIPKTRARPPSPLSKLLHRSADANTAIDLVISQITSGDISVCIQSLAQIDGMLKKEDRAELLTNHVDQLLVAITVQLKMAHTKHMGDPNTDSEDVITLCRALLGTLLELFQSKVLSKVASRDVLKELISMMVTILLDRRLEDFSEGPQLMRSVNVMVVKIVEKSNSTNVMSALIKLFHECMASETCSYKFIELVMKCLWKMMRMLPDIINDIDVEVILYDLHAFLKQFPTYTWKDRAEGDTPLRTVKTIMHSLAKMKGNKILSDIGRIENPAESEVVQYLNKVLKHGVGGGTAVAVSNTKNEQNGSSEDSKTPRRESTGKSSKRLSKSTHDTLAEIFKKIGSKENTREGLNDLYDFKQKNPEADLEPFLRKSSQFFQNYIERGLKNIELERQAGEKLPTPSFGSMSSQPEGVQLGASLDTAKGDVNPAMYMERLKILRARCGLDNNSQQSTETVQKPVKSSSEETLASNLPTLSSSGTSTAQPQESGDDNSENKPAAAQVNVADLKKRLDRIKRQAQMDS
ncbi:cytoskeleton-associated protein 5-like, partial [Lingula anatina]|uniref:Cytoskeleton-associated protein 5-like n=1 Tax=Lingula anatina TaxID=7574 RepID=A0A1S3II35_LINAN